jgi:hypothetical protein
MYCHTIIGRVPYERATTPAAACAANDGALLLASQFDEYYQRDQESFYKARIQATAYYYELQQLLKPRANPVTNATYKIIELLAFISKPVGSPLEVLRDPSKKRRTPLKVFFNCEMPGAMLKFTHDCLKRKHIPATFIASSLVDPVKKAFLDNYGVFSRGLAKVLMNAENNGDVTLSKNVRDFRRRYPNWADLYVADGAVNLDEDFGGIEERNLAVCLGQLLSGLACVAKGGILIYKTFTFVHPLSQGMISLMTTCFDAVSIVKPVTSRAANSEIFVVGTGYTPLSSARLDELIRYLDLESLATAGELCPPHPSLDHVQCELSERQMAGLQIFINALQGQIVDNKPAREARAQAWLEEFSFLL